MNNKVYMESKDNDSKKIFAAIFMILFLMLCTTGATFAYFSATASEENVITGNAATVSLIFSESPTQVAPTLETEYAEKPLVPQHAVSGSGTNLLQKAVTGTSFPSSGVDSDNIPCVDANGNAVCREYEFKIQNTSNVLMTVKGQIIFEYPEDSQFSNLKCKLMESKTNINADLENKGIDASTETWSDFVENVELSPGEEKEFWLLFWIEEIDDDQSEIDTGTFNGSIQFINNVDGSGITSTFVD